MRRQKRRLRALSFDTRAAGYFRLSLVLFCLPSNSPSPTPPRVWPRPDGHATPNSFRRILREPLPIACHTYRRRNRQIRNDTMVGEDLIGWQRGGVRQNRIRPVPGHAAVISQEPSIEDLLPVC